MSETIGLVGLGPTEDYSIQKLRDKVSDRFPDCQVQVCNSMDTPAMAFDPGRNQYHSTRILTILEENVKSIPAEHVLAVASFDLYVPGMNFVFGEARCPGRVAVISTYRLKTSRIRDATLESRAVKEAVHEIGHMFGLKHCSKVMCVMHFSERLADTDKKQDTFCPECEHKMKWIEVE
jgi:archaemetzincin